MAASKMDKPIILIVTHVLPYPPRAGNEIRILNMINWLRSRGYSVALLLNYDFLEDSLIEGISQVVDEVYLRDKPSKKKTVLSAKGGLHAGRMLATKVARAIGLSCFLGQRKLSREAKESLCPPSLVSTTARLCRELTPVAIIAEYIFTAPCLDVVPGSTLKIIDTIDMFSRKKEQVLKYGIQDRLACSREEERCLLLKGDVIVAIQKKEEELFRDLVPERKVITVGIDFPVKKQPAKVDLERGSVLVVGSDNPLNIHGLNAFCRYAWPKILAAEPKATLKVVGKVGNHLNSCHAGIVKIGTVPNLDEEYRRAVVVVNPVMAGTGLKIKSVEALCQGKALITTPNGAEGIGIDGAPPYLVCDNWEEFAEAVIGLVLSDERRDSFEKRAREYALKFLNVDNVYAPLDSVLSEHMQKVAQL